MTARLTRQQMKRDEVMESIGSAVRFLWTHPKGILMSLGVVLIVAAVWAGIVQWRAGRGERANTLLAQALESRQAAGEAAGPAGDGTQTPTKNGRRQSSTLLQQVVDDYGSTGAAAAARLLLAADAASAGNAERAVELWDQVGERRDDVLAMEAELNLIEHLRTSGEGEAVVERLRRELDQGSGALPADVVMGELAATLELLGRADEADTVRQQLRERFPESPWLTQPGTSGGTPITVQ